ncbi:MAG: hypothetical protein ACI9GH_000418 [Candidatus Paceibacteria bacterium]|jgi:hypothetical protein
MENETNVVIKPEATPKDFFLNVGVMASLYWLTISYIILIFEVINTIFPDEALYRGETSVSTFTLSSLIIITPVFLILTNVVNKHIKANPIQRDVWVRKWVIYFTLFIAGITVITDMIVILNFFLSGELTTRFITKSLVLVIIPLVIFWYLVTNLKRDYVTSSYYKSLVIGVIVVIIGTIVGAFVAIGTPSEQRDARIDEQRINDLRVVQSEVIGFYTSKKRLPESIDELEDVLRGFQPPVDPESDESYKYSVNGTETFTLCADFNSKQDYLEKRREYYYDDYYGTDAWIWNHIKGETCFERTIDPEKLESEINPIKTPRPIF